MILAVQESPNDGAAVYYLPYPTGSVANIAVTVTGGTTHFVSVYSVYNTEAAPVTADGGQGSAVVNALIDDIIIACNHRRSASSTTWVGVTLDAGYSYGGYASCASIKRTSPVTNVTNSGGDTAAVVFR